MLLSPMKGFSYKCWPICRVNRLIACTYKRKFITIIITYRKACGRPAYKWQSHARTALNSKQLYPQLKYTHTKYCLSLIHI